MRIGVFDSGVGGMTVVQALRKECPWADIIYFGDTARVPYGTKSENTIIRYTGQVISFLLQFRVDLLVAACNTASALGVPKFTRKVPVPMVDVIGPACESLTMKVSRGPVLVLATKSTISSGVYGKTLSRLSPGLRVYEKSCPLFVPLVEEGLTQGPLVQRAVNHYLRGLPKPETILLGCTHYPLLKGIISRYWKGRVRIVDSAAETARRTSSLLLSIGNGSLTNKKKGKLRCYVSDDPASFQKQAYALTRLKPDLVRRCDIEKQGAGPNWKFSRS